MDNVVISFKPKSEIDSEKNLVDFISYCKNELTNFNGVKVNNTIWTWDSNYWTVNFNKVGEHSKSRREESLLHKDILNFSKAYVRHQSGHEGTDELMKAIRCIEKAMLSINGNTLINQVNSAVFDEAIEVAREFYAEPHQAGKGLMKLASFLNEKKLVSKNFVWKTSTSRNKDSGIRIGSVARKNRAAKMPDEESLGAIAELFSLYPNLKDRDIFTTSTMALMMSSPDRASEVFLLPVLANPYYGKDKDGIDRMGLRWFGLKGFGEVIKWVPSVMEPVVNKAIERIKVITEPARNLAKLYEDNIDKFPRHPVCPDVADDKLLTKRECALALGVASAEDGRMCNVNSFLRQRGLKVEDYKYSLTTLLPTIKKELPDKFPILHEESGLKWSDALFCMFKDQLANSRPTSNTSFWLPTKNTLAEDLKQTKKSQKSIFQRYNFPSEYKLKTHEPRHLLTTLAKEAGMEDELLAEWAGRANIKQNTDYDQRTTEERKKNTGNAINNIPIQNKTSALARFYEINPPKTKQEINLQYNGTQHFTEFGYCEHDFIVSPCSRHRDCLNCSEQTCVKGELEKEVNLRERYSMEKLALQRDDNAIKEGKKGANRHYHKRLKTIEKIEVLLAIYDDPKVEDGSQIKLVADDALHKINKELSANNKPELKSSLNATGKHKIRKKPIGLNKVIGYSRKKNG
jgi:hypothetical protein